MKATDPIWQELRAAQDATLERSTALQHVREVHPSRGRAAGRRELGRRQRALLAAAVTVVAIAVWLLAPSVRSTALDFTFDGGARGEVGAWIAALPGRSVGLSFSDGTRLKLTDGARARVATTTPDGAHLVLERGGLQASVEHRPSTDWQIDVGPFRVHVVGTRFGLAWDLEREAMRIELLEGAVEVTGGVLHRPIRVEAGQVLVVSATDADARLSEPGAGAPTSEPRPSGPVPPLAPTMATGAAPEPVASAPRGTSPGSVSRERPMGAGSPAAGHAVSEPAAVGTPERAPSSWQSLAGEGRYAAALAMAERSGFDAICRKASGATLVELGDTSRFARSPARARQAYLAARAKLPRGGRTAYSLGLTAFDQQSDYASAIQWFRTYLAEQPTGALRAEAMGRLMDALQRRGRGAEARRAAERYLASYPGGGYSVLAHELTSR